MRLKYTAKPGCEPKFGNAFAAGIDLRSKHEVRLSPGESMLVELGICVEIPIGHVGLLVGRSSLRKRGIACNIGVIDEDYRGEVMASLESRWPQEVMIEQFERICQMLVLPVARVSLHQVDALSATSRGTKGFGSTGAK
jgi:dUTP pyrophosphatase